MYTQTRTTQLQVSAVRLSSANGSNEHITHLLVSGTAWSKQQVINEIERPSPVYTFITNVNGKIAVVGVRSNQYGKYLQTHADGYWNNNLLALPRF